MKIIRQGRVVVVVFKDNTHCSKVYNDVEYDKACQKAKIMEQDLIERNVAERPFTLEELLSKDKKRYKLLHKFHIVQPRFQDKRAVERLISKNTSTYSNRKYVDFKNKPIVNIRPSELLIPFVLDNRTQIYIRESRVFDTKYRNRLGEKFKTDEDLLDYIESYKSTIKDRVNENENKKLEIAQNN